MTDMIYGSMPPEQIISTYWAETRRINREQALSLTKYREDKQAESYRQALLPIKKKDKPTELAKPSKPSKPTLYDKHNETIVEMCKNRVLDKEIYRLLNISDRKYYEIKKRLKEEGRI